MYQIFVLFYNLYHQAKLVYANDGECRIAYIT